ncbi:MAG: hypothetical protein ACK5N8_08525 [Alphaproteobacteria bacterium]
MDRDKIYDNFIEKNIDFTKKLYKTVYSEKESLIKTEEHPMYNFGTMKRDGDISISPNIYLTNGNEFEKKLSEMNVNTLSEEDKKAHIVFDFLQEKGSDFSFEKNGNDVIFKNGGEDVTRKSFYAYAIYEDITSNTNYIARHIGDMQLITLPNSVGKMPRGTETLSPETKRQIAEKNKENPELLPQIFLKRGLYHEAVHVTMGTNDERKCDTFAMLKIMQEHPKEAELICEIYNHARSKSAYVIEELHNIKGNVQSYERSIKKGTMTYLMPNTYKKLKEIAKNPKILEGKSDTELMTETYNLTKNYEFNDKQLKDFDKLLKKENISKNDLENSEIMQALVEQSGSKNFDEYLDKDPRLQSFLKSQKKKNEN